MSKCKDCMWDAPYPWCCKTECHEHEYCNECKAESQQITNKCSYEQQGENT